jgi:TolA-binding protein
MMHTTLRGKRPVLLALVLALAATGISASAQNADADTAAEARMRKIESEIRALQRQVFPGGDAKFFPPQVQPSQAASTPIGTPASTPVTDLLARMDAVEAQLARLTAQGEENANKLTLLEARINTIAPTPAPSSGSGATPGAPDPAPTVSLTPGPVASPSASAPAPVVAVVTPRPAPAVTAPAVTAPAVTAPASKPAVTTATPAVTKPAPAGKPTPASAKRIAAVQAIEKPTTADPADDEYSYGFRLWEAKFYPEAQQQLKMFLQKYPKHSRLSYARNLLGRAYLDEGNPREAASWFLQNYQSGKTGDRAADSLLYLAEAMRQLKDTSRACVALSQFGDDYPREAAGRLKAQYETIRAGVKCN